MNIPSSMVARVGASTAAFLLVGGLAASSAWAADPTPSPSAAAQGKVTFGLGPASATDLDARPDFTLLQARGGDVDDHVALVNLSTTDLPITLYVVDAVTGADGQVALAPKDAKASDLAAWVKFNYPGGKSLVVVPARGKVVVPFHVTVPDNAPVGDHLAGIVASITAKSGVDAGAPDLALEQRVGVRLNMRVAGELKPELAIENLKANYVGTLNPVGKGNVVVSYTVRNAGNVKLGGKQNVTIKGLIGGGSTAADLQDIPLLMPGASVDVTTVVSDVAPLIYLSSEVAVTAVAPGTDANPVVAPASASTHIWAVPWTLLALLLALGLLATLLLRRRKSPPATGGSGNQPVAPMNAPPSGPVLIPSGPPSQGPTQ